MPRSKSINKLRNSTKEIKSGMSRLQLTHKPQASIDSNLNDDIFITSFKIYDQINVKKKTKRSTSQLKTSRNTSFDR